MSHEVLLDLLRWQCSSGGVGDVRESQDAGAARNTLFVEAPGVTCGMRVENFLPP